LQRPQVPEYRDFTSLLERAVERLQRAAEERGGYIARIDSASKPVVVVGDIHGDYYSFSVALKLAEEAGALESGVIVFLGDYVDRGPPEGQVAVVAEIASLIDSLGPERVVALRGNHEPPEGLEPFPHDYGDALASVYGESRANEAYALSRRLFDSMPHAAIAEGKAVFLHGGLPVSGFELGVEGYLAANREPWSNFVEILWNDPTDEPIKYVDSPRGIGYLFGREITEKALQVIGAKRVVRGHEAAEEGYKVNHDGLVLTLFSRLGPPYYNAAAAALACPSLEDLASNPLSCIRRWR